MAKYNKTALTINEQILLLKKRNLTFKDLLFAKQFLTYSNYYRLSGYYKPFQDKEKTDWFITGTCFKQIIELYHFDRKLKLCVSEGISAVEISFRTQIAYALSIEYGPFAILDPQAFAKGHDNSWIQLHEHIIQETERSKEIFVRHFKNSYEEYPDIPIWVLTEILSFGTLSKLYKSLSHSTKQSIAHNYKVDKKLFESWMHSLAYIRNICAHHSRLWNRNLSVPPKLPKKDPQWLDVSASNIFSVIIIINHILSACGGVEDLKKNWQHHFESLFEKTIEVNDFLKSMGMDINWKDHPLWKK